MRFEVAEIILQPAITMILCCTRDYNNILYNLDRHLLFLPTIYKQKHTHLMIGLQI
jgi:hypothetical protein